MRTFKDIGLILTAAVIISGCSSFGHPTMGGNRTHILPAFTRLTPDVNDATASLLGPQDQPYVIEFEVLDTAEAFNSRHSHCSERPENQNLAACLTLTIHF
ncbi:MAG: hypothetical protein PVH30_10340 [Desulfobacterales bacterium]|jgi:hypothetical protein